MVRELAEIRNLPIDVIMTKRTKYRVRQNRWGNWYGYAGSKRVAAFANDTVGGVASDTVCGACGTDGGSTEPPSAAVEWLAKMEAQQ